MKKRKDCFFKLCVAPSKKVEGRGLFAGEFIPWGMRIIQYTGEIVQPDEYKRRQVFQESIGYTSLFELDGDVCVDGLVGGNESLFANHSATEPNICFLRENGEIWFVAYDDIQKGEELLFDYGYDVGDHEKALIAPHKRVSSAVQRGKQRQTQLT